MATTKEIKNHIKSVKDMQKITGAMHLIASTKLRRAKRELDHSRPYFNALRGEIKRIFRTVENVESRYFYPHTGENELPGAYGFLVITADKGLAGAYNQNVIKEAMRMMEKYCAHDPKLFVVGEYGRHYFAAHNVPIEKSFLYTAQNPTVHRAREISSLLLDLFLRGELSKLYVIYTDMKGAIESQVLSTRLLPFHRDHFVGADTVEAEVREPFEFEPSVQQVLDNVVPSYVTGFIYSALIDSFCCEQNARMNAMDSASRNAQKLLDELSVEYNHIRQSAITQEITEISSGAKSMKQKSRKRKEGVTV